MIVVRDDKGKILGYYDTPSDVWADYPEAEIHGGEAFVR